MTRHLSLAVLLTLALLASPAAAADPELEEITLELIMSDPDWLGNRPEDPYWSDDGRHVYYWQKRPGEEIRDLYRVPAAGGEPERVPPAELGRVPDPGGDWSHDRRRMVYSRQGDLFVKDLESGEIRQLTRTAAAETAPRFLADERRVAFEREGTIFVRDLATGLESQPADLRLEDDPDDEEEPEDYLARQQERLFEVIRDQKDDRERRRAWERELQSADPTRPPLPWYLGDGVEIRHRSLSPSGDWMVLVVIDEDHDDGRKDQMPRWVTPSGYVEVEEVRPKVGTGDGRSERLWVLDLAKREKHEIDLGVLPGIRDDPLADLRAAAEARRQAEAEGSESEDGEGGAKDDESEDDGEREAGEPEPRSVRFEEPFAWTDDGELLAVQAHSYDNKDRWTAVVRRGRFELEPVHHLTNEGWINWSFNDYGWLPDGRTLYYLSEETGYSQLYVQPLGGTPRRLSEDGAVVDELAAGPRGEWLYYVSNPEHPGIFEVYRVAVTSGERQKLTGLGGLNSYALSPDGEKLAVLHSTATVPPELYAQAARPGAETRRLVASVSERFRALPWIEPEVVAIPSTHHDRPIYSRYYGPRDGGPRDAGETGGDGEGRPAVVFIHGAGYLQNAHQGWSSYFREFLFHTFLVEQGYVVLDMDYRGSANYGADWRTAIYRQMGTPELEDLRDGVDWLVRERGVDRGRVGVYGGSYGGFLVMMALFKEPDLFACGAALRPVTDWAHYNHSYTSNILNTPDVDPEAYERSSPIEFAAGLEKPLLIAVPMLDDNVFFQDTVRLAQRLIELEKEGWEVALYPVEPHAFQRPSSWLNEYRRIFRLFENCLEPGPDRDSGAPNGE